MARPQSSYSENLDPGIIGQIANTQPCAVDTYISELAAGIPFGRAVRLGTDEDRVDLGITDNRFVGITVKDPTLDPSDNDLYDRGTHVAVLYRGDIWVSAEGIVNAGENVTVDPATGRLSSAVAGVEELNIDEGGAGFSAAPAIAFSGGGGLGAAATATLTGGIITGTTISAEGSGYTSTPTVTLSGGTPTTEGALSAVLSRVKILGARWMSTTTAANQLAIVRLSGDLPAR